MPEKQQQAMAGLQSFSSAMSSKHAVEEEPNRWNNIERLIKCLGEMTEPENSNDADTPRLSHGEVANEGWTTRKMAEAVTGRDGWNFDGDIPGSPLWRPPMSKSIDIPSWKSDASGKTEPEKGQTISAGDVDSTDATGETEKIGNWTPQQSSSNITPAATISRGSVGHPHLCASPCKYVRRKGGCRDGEACTLCHVCLWQRRPFGKPPAAQQATANAGKSLLAAAPAATSPENGTEGRTSDLPPKRVDLKNSEPLYVKPLVALDIDIDLSYPTVNDMMMRSPAPPCSQLQSQAIKLDLSSAISGWDVSPPPAIVQPQKDLAAATAVCAALGAAMASVRAAPNCDVVSSSHVPVFEGEATTSMMANGSIGSIGHPLTCNKPCKYYNKSKGCKDGRNCTRCHFCVWSRLMER